VVEPGDIMILVRSRGELARLIVSRLYEAGVPVAGVDRLRLGAPIAVQDLLACVRFALQPRDDLSLASLLVSPLVGWTQEQLYERAKGRTGELWQHLGDHKPEELIRIRNMADRTTPYQFLEAILSGDIRGRQKLIARLGEEARDPIEALLSAALDFEQQAMPSLQLFLDWFDRDDVEIKRDPAKPENAVRVMTVHGAKGLQAPVVVLADATSDPGFKRKTDLKWEVEPGLVIPLFRPKKEEQAGSLKTSAEAQDARETQEHWRLLYVAMTRAEEHLVIGGALGRKQQKDGVSPRCWHSRIAEALTATGRARDVEGALLLEHQDPIGRKSKQDAAIETWPGRLPDWALSSAAPEAKPPRPLAPSRAEVPDQDVSPPPSDKMRRAAQRGVLLHSLFERLPGVPRAERAEVADSWLEHSAGVSDTAQRHQLIKDALGVIEHSDFADIFSEDALAEVPLAGVVNGRVIAGAVDRLLVRADNVLVVDFKTGRRVPETAAAVSVHHKAQMAAYVAVLEGIFPGRTVRAALLYSTGPALILLPPEVIEAHKPGFTDAQEDLSAPG
jgi:ATP-dependent helicase/nuclease subunit A